MTGVFSILYNGSTDVLLQENTSTPAAGFNELERIANTYKTTTGNNIFGTKVT